MIFNEIGVSSEQGSPKNRAGGLVAGHQSFICGQLHHPSGLQGQRFVRCRIGFTCCKEGFEDNLEKLEEAGFPHMQTQGGTCLPSGTSPHAHADAGSFREFRMERSGILEAMTLASPVGMGRSMMQAHRSDWVKVSLSLAPPLSAGLNAGQFTQPTLALGKL